MEKFISIETVPIALLIGTNAGCSLLLAARVSGNNLEMTLVRLLFQQNCGSPNVRVIRAIKAGTRITILLLGLSTLMRSLSFFEEKYYQRPLRCRWPHRRCMMMKMRMMTMVCKIRVLVSSLMWMLIILLIILILLQATVSTHRTNRLFCSSRHYLLSNMALLLKQLQ